MGKKVATKKAAAPESPAASPAQEAAPAPKAAVPEAELPPAAAAIAGAAAEAGAKEWGETEVVQFTPEAAVQYDLTSKMTQYLDRHLIFPMLSSLQKVGMYKDDDVARAELQLLSETCMIDFAIDKYEAFEGTAPDSLHERREDVVEKIKTMRDGVWDFLQVLEDPERVKRIPQFKSVEDMCQDFDLEHDVVDKLAEYAKLQFDCGDYRLSSELLKHYRNMPQASEVVTSKYVSCIWGSLASLLLVNEFEETHEQIAKLDQLLEDSKAPKREVLLHRSWLLHWTLFAIFSLDKFDKVDPKTLDFFLNEKSLSIISLSCPHLFRYVGACLILQKRLKHLVKEIVWIINNESGSYSDPVTRFLQALYMEMDFDDAQRELQKCELVCKGDHFLEPHWADFQENARLHIFESYCRTHQCINIQMIASKLNMGAVEAELWIVKLIQNAKLDARIDSEKSRVVMTKAPPNVYQQVIEKTKNLAFRSTMLVSNLEKN